MMTDSKRLLVTGGKGMLGSALFNQAGQFSEFEVRAPGRGELDVRNPEAIAAMAAWVEGGWIVHCAARVDVEACAREPEDARQIIVDGTRNVAEFARKSGARLLFPQSFLIYDGGDCPIAEDEQPRPLSLYGALKYEAEQVAASIVDDALIIRMAGFFGGEAADKNFVGRIIPVMLGAIRKGETHFEVGNRVWQPTWTEDLALNALELMRDGVAGSYQMASEGQASFAEIAREITVALGWQDHLEIVTVDASLVAQSELGRRPDVAVMSCSRLTGEGRNRQRAWRPALHAYLKAPFFNQYRLEATS